MSSTLSTIWLVLSENFLFSSLPAQPVISGFPVSPLSYSGPRSIWCLKGPSAIKSCSCHPKSTVSCCSLESRCHFATSPSCDSGFPTSHASCSFFSPEVKYTNCSVNNGGCEHFCKDDPANQCRYCSCASGYQLKDDHTMCEPVGERRMFTGDLTEGYSNVKTGKFTGEVFALHFVLLFTTSTLCRIILCLFPKSIPTSWPLTV